MSNWCDPMPSTDEILVRTAATKRLREFVLTNEKTSRLSSLCVIGRRKVDSMEAVLKKLEVGQFVRYCSEDRQWYDALITCIHGEPHKAPHWETGEEILSYPCVNLSFVSADENAQDQYGRQMERDKTSISHYGQYVASGFFWCHAEDEEIAHKQLCEALQNMKS